MAAVLQSFTALGKGLAVAIVAGGVLVQVAPSVEGSLGLIAARAIPRPWTLFSCAFLHANILNVSPDPTECRMCKWPQPQQRAAGGGRCCRRSAMGTPSLARSQESPPDSRGAVQMHWRTSASMHRSPRLVLAAGAAADPPAWRHAPLPCPQSLAYGVAVLFLARIVEPIYGSRELFKYLSIVITLTSFLVWFPPTSPFVCTLCWARPVRCHPIPVPGWRSPRRTPLPASPAAPADRGGGDRALLRHAFLQVLPQGRPRRRQALPPHGRL